MATTNYLIRIKVFILDLHYKFEKKIGTFFLLRFLKLGLESRFCSNFFQILFKISKKLSLKLLFTQHLLSSPHFFEMVPRFFFRFFRPIFIKFALQTEKFVVSLKFFKILICFPVP